MEHERYFSISHVPLLFYKKIFSKIHFNPRLIRLTGFLL